MNFIKHAVILAVLAALFTGCGKKQEEQPPANAGTAPVKTATPVLPVPKNIRLVFCPTCNRDTGKGHICKETRLCTICYNETGLGHIHKKLADGSYDPVPLTHYCRECKNEVGKNHQMRPAPEHCMTYFCERCEFDVGPKHICGVTHFCPKCEEEAGVNHKCGKSEFCRECKNDVLKEAFCPNCYTTLGAPESAETQVFCPVCNKEVTAVKHDCRTRKTFFCPVCEKEQPVGHRHKE